MRLPGYCKNEESSLLSNWIVKQYKFKERNRVQVILLYFFNFTDKELRFVLSFLAGLIFLPNTLIL